MRHCYASLHQALDLNNKIQMPTVRTSWLTENYKFERTITMQHLYGIQIVVCIPLISHPKQLQFYHSYRWEDNPPFCSTWEKIWVLYVCSKHSLVHLGTIPPKYKVWRYQRMRRAKITIIFNQEITQMKKHKLDSIITILTKKNSTGRENNKN